MTKTSHTTKWLQLTKYIQNTLQNLNVNQQRGLKNETRQQKDRGQPDIMCPDIIDKDIKISSVI